MGEVKKIDYDKLVPTEGAKKKPLLSKYVKNFMFSSFQASGGYKKAEKAIGDILTVSFVIEPTYMSIMAHSELKEEEIKFTDKEKKQFLKIIQFDEEKVKKYEYIFIILDMVNQIIKIQNLPIGAEQPNEYEI